MMEGSIETRIAIVEDYGTRNCSESRELLRCFWRIC
jgi:hypothetical protein